jgi:hypothetical protein
VSRDTLTAEYASAVLDQLVYELVLDCIDLKKLYGLEEQLAMAIGQTDKLGEDAMMEISRAMIGKAIRRIPDDHRQYVKVFSAFEKCKARCEHDDA